MRAPHLLRKSKGNSIPTLLLRQTKEHHCLDSDFVLFPVGTGVLFKMLKTGK